MTEQERNHLLRMVKHAEKTRRNMDNLRATNKPLTPEELAKAIKRTKEKYPGYFPEAVLRKTVEYKRLIKPDKE